MSTAVEAVIFDLDGTLVHSDLDFDLIRRQIGIEQGPVLEALENFAPADRQKAMDILHRHESRAADQARLDESAHHIFAQLADRGIKTALLTRNSRDSANTVIRRHALTFDFVCAREDSPIKPSPQPVLAICAALNVAPAAALMIGDYLFDLQSANQANVRSVLLRNQRNAEFEPLAWKVIDRLDQLLDLVDA